MFVYRSNIDLTKTTTIDVENTSVKEILEKILPESVTYTFENSHIILSTKQNGEKFRKVSGIITDPTGTVPMASVMVKGTKIVIASSDDGKYTINIPSDIENPVLVFSFIGLTSHEEPVRNRAEINVRMNEADSELDEVVVIGYGSVRKKDVTTSVSIVSTDDIKERPMVSAASAIQGKAAGVQVVQTSGRPGAGLSVRVRGSSSINAGNDPLYVVDGIPMADVSSLAPSDIATMQILKDASSAAIYGARAANGVVLITTKQGKAGQSRITFDSYLGVSNVAKRLEALNTDEYLEYMSSVDALANVIPQSDLSKVRKVYTNWNDEVFRTGLNQNYQLSFSGGNDKMRYFASGGIVSDKGVVLESKYNRYNFRFNADTDVKKWLKFATNFSYSNSAEYVVPEGRADLGGVIQGILVTPPYISVYEPGGSGKFGSAPYGAAFDNPVANTTRGNNIGRNHLIAGVNLQFNIAKGLTFKPSIAIDYDNTITKSFIDPHRTLNGRSQNGIASDTRWQQISWINENVLSYDKTFNQNHNLSAVAVLSLQKNKWDRLFMSSKHFGELPQSWLPSVGLGNLVDNASGDKAAEWSLLSYIGRLSYNYKHRYLLTVNMRADGSSKLAPKKRMNYFPSLSTGWRISDESFMKGMGFLSDMKIRFGIGQNGNQGGISEYSYLQLYDFSRTTGEYPSITVGEKSNSTLTWEKTTQSNIGLDMSLFNSRLTLTLDLYHKNTDKLLIPVQFSSIITNKTILMNAGEITNNGFEIALSSKNIDNKDFFWSTDFNISFNRNKLESLGGAPHMYTGLISAYNTEYSVLLKPGEPIGMFYGYKSLGVDSQTGKLMFEVAEGNDKFEPQDSDRQFIGDPNPDFIAGLTNTFAYKNFSLNLFLQSSYGNDILNAGRMYPEDMQTDSNHSKEILKRWRKPGDVSNIPGANNTTNPILSSHYIEDGSYLRLKTLSLSYRLPEKMLKKLDLSKLQFFATAENLLTFTKYKGYDPEVNATDFQGDPVVSGVDFGTYPQVRTIVFGVNIEF